MDNQQGDLRRVVERLDPSLLGLYDSLSETDKLWAQRCVSEMAQSGKSISLDFLTSVDYVRHPVSIEEFLTNEYYLGGIDVWPRWATEVKFICNPVNQISEVILGGGIGLGKCVVEGTLIPTDDGFLKIEEIVSGGGAKSVQSESGMRQIDVRHDEGLTDTIRVVTKNGHEIEGRPNHRIRVLRGCNREWVQLKDVRYDDVLLQSPSGFGSRADIPVYVAELVGWYIAEGVVVNDNHRRLDLSEDEVGYVRALAKMCEGYLESTTAGSDEARTVTVNTPKAHEFFPSGTSHFKEVPRCIRESSRETVAAFLRGLFSGDGDVSPTPALVTMSRNLALQVRSILTAMGYYCSVRTKDASYKLPTGNCVQTGTAYRVAIIGADSKDRFAEEVGFVQEHKQERLLEQCAESTNSDHAFGILFDLSDVDKLRQMQPIPNSGLGKYNTPRGKLKRLARGQRCTVRLLREIAGAGGNLPDDLRKIASGELLFDTVQFIQPSKTHCYDLTVVGDPSYVSGGFISHNTFNAMIMMLYKLYELSCLREPAAYHGLAKGSAIVFGIYNSTLKLTDVGVDTIVGLLNASPYFRENFWYKEQYGDYQFPKNIKIMIGSQAFHVLGRNLYCLAIDEMNFHDQTKKQAKSKTMAEKGKIHELVTQTSRRMESRFKLHGRGSGLILHISSTRTSTSYLELRKKEVKDKPGVHIVEGPQWEFHKPEEYCGKRFRFAVGNKFVQAHSLDKVVDNGYRNYDVIPMKEAPKGVRIIEPPVEDYWAFEEDPIGSIRDIAGIPSEAIDPFFPRSKPVIEATNPTIIHPFVNNLGASWASPMIIDLETNDRIEDFVERDALLTVRSSREVPRHQSHSPRFIHCDLARNGDALGLAMVHPTRAVTRMVRNEEGELDRRIELNIAVDFAIQIKPRVSEVDWQKVREFVIWLKDRGFNILNVSYDSPASGGELQYFKKLAIPCQYLSVDRRPTTRAGKKPPLMPYHVLKTLLNEGRIQWAPNEVLEDELLALEKIEETEQIDHPPGGSKDVADGVCGAVFLCMQDDKVGTMLTPVDSDALTHQDRVLTQVNQMLARKREVAGG